MSNLKTLDLINWKAVDRYAQEHGMLAAVVMKKALKVRGENLVLCKGCKKEIMAKFMCICLVCQDVFLCGDCQETHEEGCNRWL